MTSHDSAAVVYCVFNTAGLRGRVLEAFRPDRAPCEWSLPRRSAETKVTEALRDFVGYCGDAPLVTLDAETISELLSRPEMLALAAPQLRSMRDLRLLARIFLPLEEGWGGRSRSRRRSEAGLSASIEEMQKLYARVIEAVGEAPEELLAVLQALLSEHPSFSWLPWPSERADATAVLQISAALPGKPPGRNREGSAEHVRGDLVDVSRDILSPTGAVAKLLPGYEHREGQVQMAVEVARALRDEQFLLVEAGTGVGKSLAYLVPAILWAREQGEPVVVSTNTKNLQEQLIEKDLPLLREALPVSFEAALLKGRGNYPCVRALITQMVDATQSLFRDACLAAGFLCSWLVKSYTGDLEEIPASAYEELPELTSLVSRVRSQGEACLGQVCSHNGKCPVERARGFARRADVVVANHALTFADSRAAVLPTYSRLIFDEAQNVETVATDGLSLECSAYGFNQLARALSGDPSSFAGLMARRLDELGDGPGVSAARDTLEQLPTLVDELLGVVDAFGDAVGEFCRNASRDRRGDGERASVRLTEAARRQPGWDECAALGAAAVDKAQEVRRLVSLFVAGLAEIDKSARPGSEGMDADAQAMLSRVEGAIEALATVMDPGEDNARYVTWAEVSSRGRRGPSWKLQAAPVDVGPVLDEAVYREKASIIFASATMTLEGDFRYFRQRLGLDTQHERLVEAKVPSPFKLTEQLLLCVPTDMPDPSDRGYNDASIDALREICRVADGGTLALFTARSRMQKAFEALEDDLEEMGLNPICQDVSGPRTQLLDELRGDPSTVLFGLKSFWEGVDVPGRALRCVVICKLPFAVPSDPIVEARQEDAARKGLNPMQDYYIPDAIMAFKQGFGRLIRTSSDTGVVYVLDRRILTKPYGLRFFRSIQRCALTREPLEQCLEQTKAWLARPLEPAQEGQEEA